MLHLSLKWVALIPLMAASATYADTPPAAGPSVQPSLQQLFNTASEAEMKEDCATALPIFNNLMHDSRVKAGSLPAATIAVRQGHCLIHSGKSDEGELSVEQGLPMMQKAGLDFAGDVMVAEQDLGDMELLRNDRDAAVQHYQALLSMEVGPARNFALLRLAMVTAFDGGSQPLAYADEALRIASAQPKPDKKALSLIHDIHGRILLNQGQVKPAYAELKQALDLSGGLTNRVSLVDVQLRGDLAQAALLNGDRDEARKYLSYTGEGRIAESPFAVAIAMDAPDCGTETGLKPEDSAIVEFSIADDGSVAAAQTVYSRGNFAVAAAFANAVDKWFWRAEDLGKLPRFYRALTRVEVRCSNRGGNVPRIDTPLASRFLKWAATELPKIQDKSPFMGAGLQRLKDLGEAVAMSGDRKTASAALGAWAILNSRIGAPVVDAFDRAITLGQQAAIPAEAINALRVLRVSREVHSDPSRSRSATRYTPVNHSASLLPVANDPAVAADPLAADTALMLSVPEHPNRSDQDAAIMLARRVADDSRLPDHFPLRQAALLWLANQSAQAGKLDEAHAYFQRTGLNEEQCALIGPQPAMRSSGVSSSDYPMEALNMGFEGWVRLEFNINANGTTADARSLISYPPFVFEDAATGMAKDIRYQPSYRPSGGEACSAQSTSIRFIIPANH